ncbi:hypothetical protein B9Z19DRAFT_1067283 [Tuber borchii]|uniref:Uncharacterized protein n=1 Tax=Tuber borchii TaxID=42251 RepID=A0A2T6ZJD8_TUBBO|nr:hypothetical protein B9Z19DRAFT_1067283 [Tuber borchii]
MNVLIRADGKLANKQIEHIGVDLTNTKIAVAEVKKDLHSTRDDVMKEIARTQRIAANAPLALLKDQKRFHEAEKILDVLVECIKRDGEDCTAGKDIFIALYPN